jgi:hypothetical protein
MINKLTIQFPTDDKDAFKSLVEQIAKQLQIQAAPTLSTPPTRALLHHTKWILRQWRTLLDDWPRLSKEELDIAWTDAKYKYENMEQLTTTKPASFESIRDNYKMKSQLKKDGIAKGRTLKIRFKPFIFLIFKTHSAKGGTKQSPENGMCARQSHLC